jgi:malonyl-CoA O-methyltransferase
MSEERKKAICRRFSKAAATYDDHALVQRQCATRLSSLLPADFSAAEILEIGCGTGNYTKILAERFPGARLTALDFSSAMVAQARRKCETLAAASFLCADGERFLAENSRSFDLITSNATMQWFDDPARAFSHSARSLAADGLFLASFFGPGTLHELAAGLSEAFAEPVPLPAARFPDKARLAQMADTCFGQVMIDETEYRRSYLSLQELLSHIRKTGTGGYHPSLPLLTRGRMKKLEKWFTDRGGQAVSYQVFFVTAGRPRLEAQL